MSYTYLIPRYHASPWGAGGGPLHSADLNWPRVSVYCPHPDPEDAAAIRPWLLGSFEFSAESSKRTGDDYWSWWLNYPTGDGLMINLNRQGVGVSDVQYLAGDRIRDREAERDNLRRALEAGDMVAAEAASAAMQDADATTRARLPLRCGICELRRVFRLERLHSVVSGFWRAGIREVPLGTFIKAVDR